MFTKATPILTSYGDRMFLQNRLSPSWKITEILNPLSVRRRAWLCGQRSKSGYGISYIFLRRRWSIVSIVYITWYTWFTWTNTDVNIDFIRSQIPFYKHYCSSTANFYRDTIEMIKLFKQSFKEETKQSKWHRLLVYKTFQTGNLRAYQA